MTNVQRRQLVSPRCTGPSPLSMHRSACSAGRFCSRCWYSPRAFGKTILDIKPEETITGEHAIATGQEILGDISSQFGIESLLAFHAGRAQT